MDPDVAEAIHYRWPVPNLILGAFSSIAAGGKWGNQAEVGVRIGVKVGLGGGQASPHALIGAEKEGLILDDGPPKGKPELVLYKVWNLAPY